MNGHSQNYPMHHPRHPSRENLHRGRQQLPPNPLDGNRVHFPDLEEEERGILDRLAGVFFGLLACTCIVGLLTLLAILYVVVRPFSISAYRRIANQLCAASFLDALALLLPNTRIFLTGDSDVPSPVGTSIIVSNHLMDGDWWGILMLGRCVGLRGSVKAMLRNEILNLNVQNGERSQSRVPSTSISLARNGSGGESNLSSSASRDHTTRDLAIMAKLLHAFLDFPLLNGEDYISDREKLFHLLRSFAENNGAEAPVHLLFFPEGWSLHNGVDRKAILAKSNEFAKREGRPHLKHLLLPKMTGFNASLECLRESSPVVYDVTMAFTGYDGSLPPKLDLSLQSLWGLFRRNFPSQIHIRIKRYSMEEVLQDSSWLDKKWAEKDRLLSHFSRHRSFPTDNRGFCRHRVFNTRTHSIEGSAVALMRLLAMPCTLPLLLFLSIPLFWTVLSIWLFHQAFKSLFPDLESRSSSDSVSETEAPGQRSFNSNGGTPFLPNTPFVSPSISNWRDMRQ